MAEPPFHVRFDRSFQTAEWAEPARPDRDIASDVSGDHRMDRLFKDVETMGEILVGDRQRNEDANDISVQPAREQHEPSFSGRSRRRGCELRALLLELEREHGAEPADVADRGEAPRDVLEPGANLLPDLRRPTLELGPRNLVEDGYRRGAGERIAAERAAQAARADGIDHLGAPCHGRQRESAAQRLAGHDQVRLDVEVLDRPDASRATDAALDLVVDEQDPVRLAHLL